MQLITQGKTNWKYILIVVVLTFLVGGGILSYLQWSMPVGPSPVQQQQKYVNIAKDFVIQKLGMDFYNKFIKTITSRIYEGCITYNCEMQITFYTNLPFIYPGEWDLDSVTKSFNAGDAIYVNVNDKDEIVHYYGPKKGFSFSISKDKAIELSKVYGLQTVELAEIIIYEEDTKNTIKTYVPAWIIVSNDKVLKQEYGESYYFRKTIYLDTEEGKLLKESSICLWLKGDKCPIMGDPRF